MVKSKSSSRANSSVFTPEVAELVAIAAAFGANCEACFKYHYLEARKLGISLDDMAKAVELADKVKNVVGRHMHTLSEKLLNNESLSQLPPPSNRGERHPPKTSKPTGRRNG